MPSLPSSTDGWAPSRRSDYHRRHDPLTVAAHDAASATQSLQPIARRRGPGRARAEPCPRWRVCPMTTVRPVGTRPESETMRGIHEPHSVTRLEHSESLGPTSLSAVPSVPGGPSQLGSELGSSRAAVSPRSAACKKASGADGSGVGEVEPRSSPQENARTEPVGFHRLHRQCRIRGHRPPGRGRRLTTASTPKLSPVSVPAVLGRPALALAAMDGRHDGYCTWRGAPAPFGARRAAPADQSLADWPSPTATSCSTACSATSPSGSRLGSIGCPNSCLARAWAASARTSGLQPV